MKDAAKKTGRSKTSIARDAAVGAKLGTAVLKRIEGTSLDKGTALEALVAMPPAEREKLIKRAEAGEKIRFTGSAAPAV